MRSDLEHCMLKTWFSVIPLRWLNLFRGPAILHYDFIFFSFFLLPKGVRNRVADWILIMIFYEVVYLADHFQPYPPYISPRFLRCTCMWIRMLIVICSGELSSCSPGLRIPRRFLFCWLQLFHWSSSVSNRSKLALPLLQSKWFIVMQKSPKHSRFILEYQIPLKIQRSKHDIVCDNYVIFPL